MRERFKRYSEKLIKLLTKPEMSILPSTMAFNIILAIIPILTVVVFIASYFDISIDLVINFINNIMPEQVSSIIIDVISGKGFDRSLGAVTFITFILASNGTYAVINTSDALYKIRNKNRLKARVSSVLLLFVIIILLVFMLIVPVFGENILKLLTNAEILSKYSDEIIKLFHFIKWPVTIMIIYINIMLLYTIAPTKNISSSETVYGSIFTTAGWLIATLVFKYYLSHFARYDILYGNLASIIIMMVWVYMLSYIYVFGLAINVSRREEQELIERQQVIERVIEEQEREKEEKKKKAKAKN